MALRVPTVSGPSVEEAPLRGGFQRSSASPELLGGAQARQIADAGRSMQVLGSELQALQERQDADMLMRAEAEVKGKYLEWEGQAKTRKGQQAWGVAKEAGEWWDKESERIGGTLENPRQKAIFGQKVQQMRGLAVGAFSGYEAGQRRESLNQATQASIVGSINLAAANPGNVELHAATKADIAKRTSMLAELNGWAPEVAEAKRTEYLTNFHKQILQGLVDRDPKAAQDYFTLNKGEIAGADHAEIEKVLKTGANARTAQEFADTVMTAGMDEAAALAEARQKFEGEQEKHVVAEIKTRFAERTGARERLQRDTADEAYGIYARTGSLNSIPAAVLARLDGRDLLALRRAHEERIDRANRQEVKLPPTDWDRYYALRSEALANPEGFKERDLRREFPYLGKAEREALIDLQTKVTKPQELKDVQTLTQQLSDTHEMLKLTGSKNAEKRGLLDRAVTDAIRAEETRIGKKLDFDGRRKIIDRMIIEGEVVTGKWYLNDPNKRLFETNEDERGRFVPKVPDDEKKKITEALKRAGKPVTDDAVLRLYREKHGLQ